MLEDGDLADSIDFLPRKGGQDVLRHIEALGLVEAITVGRRARTVGQVAQLYVPLSRSTLGETAASEQLIASLEANRAIAGNISFAMTHADWQDLTVGERAVLDAMVKKGTAFSLTRVKTLRIDVAELADRGVRSLRIDAARFIDEPEALTDFHAGDIANYLSRFGVTLLATGIVGENQIVELLEDGITLVQGPHISAPGPIRPDLMSDPRAIAKPPRVEV
jgi:cyclic-di-GMP phosphodiesterase TipF (flagellum assembly factor)